MMADSGFSSKSSSAEKGPKKLGLKKAMGSLALRVLCLSLLLVAVPLLIHNFFLYMQDYRTQVKDLYLEYESMAKSKSSLISQGLSLRGRELEAIAAVADFTKSPSLLSQQFSQIAAEQRISSLFFLANEGGGHTVCTAANLPALLGKKDLFSREMNAVAKGGLPLFSAQNPTTGAQEIILVSPVHGNQEGFLLLTLSAKELISSREGAPVSYYLTLLDEKQQAIASTNPSFNKNEIDLLSFQGWEEKTGLFYFFLEKKTRIGAAIPVANTPFTLLIDFPEELVLQLQNEEFFSRLSTLFLLLLIVGGGGTLFLTYRMAKPLRQLADDMDKVGEGDLEVRYQGDKMGFEINTLGARFNEMASSLQHHIEESQRAQVAKELLAQELQIGHEIQKGLFPRELPHFAGVEIASGFVPAKEVAGDFYDLFAAREKELLLAVADGSGKGISACLYSLLVRSMLRSFFSSSSDLKRLVENANHLLCLDTKESGFFVTAWVGVYDAKNGQLHYSCCGHPPALVRRQSGAVEELHTPGIAWGAVEDAAFSFATVSLNPGDLLLLYTDGITEAHDRQGKLWGVEKLKSSLQRAESAQQAVESVLAEIAAFSQGAPQHDDLTLLALKVAL